MRKYEAEQKALKDAEHRLGLHLIEQLLRKAKGEIPAQNNTSKNAQWRKNTSKFCLIAFYHYSLPCKHFLNLPLRFCYISSCDCHPPLNPLRRGRGLFYIIIINCVRHNFTLLYHHYENHIAICGNPLLPSPFVGYPLFPPPSAEGVRGWVDFVSFVWITKETSASPCFATLTAFARNDDSAVDSPCDRGQSCVSVPLNADLSRLCLYLVRLSLADFRCFVPFSIRENASSSFLTMRL